jgi:hypothetical protein
MADEDGKLRLVAVASAADAGEARMIHGLLQSEGIRSMIGRTRGPKSVLVPEGRVEEARAVLARVAAERESGNDPFRAY